MDRNRHDRPKQGRRTSPVDDTGGIELLEDRTRPIAAGGPSRVGVSLPGAIAGAFLIAAIAFGAGMRSTDPASAPGRDGPAAAANEDPGETAQGSDIAAGHGGATDTYDGENPGGEPAPAIDEPKLESPTTESTKAPEPTKAPPADPTLMALKLKLDGSKVLVTWAGCSVDGFWTYKVVRSTDDAATWPMGKADTLIAIAEDPGIHSFLDANVDQGTTYAYKVVALANTDAGEAIVACRTETGRITTPLPPKPTPTPAPKTGTSAFSLSVSVVEGKVLVDWTACGAAGFDVYKVVRSKDSMVTFPPTGDDAVIAAVGPDGETAAWDKGVPGGVTVYYAVFCVDKTESGYVVLANTSVKSITTPVSEPKPTPVVYAMGFNVQVTPEGVVLTWEACAKDGFAFYKVLRSRNANPSYFPWTDGTEVIAVIENGGTTTFVDHPPEGGTWYYRVQSIGQWDGQKVLLGQTPAQSVAL